MGGHPQDMHPASAHLDHEQHIQPAQKDRVKMEEIAGQQPLGLTAQKRPPRGVHLPGSWTIPLGAQDPSHGRLTQLIAQTEEFAVHSPISPPGVLAREA